MREDLTPTSGLASTRAVLADAERRLAAVQVPSPSFDAAELLAFVRNVPRTRLIMSDPVSDAELVRFESLLLRRAARVPLQHLTGTVGFRRLDLVVGPGVFVPRPETELMVEVALRELPAGEQRRLVVDLCAGSGAIGLAVATEASNVDVVGVELERAAVEWADRNMAKQAELVAAKGSTFRIVTADAGDVAAPAGALADLVGRVDVVVANPPYIPDDAVPRDPEVREHDPRAALYGGPDGLRVIRRVVETAAALLREGGLIVIEHGDEQGDGAGALGVPYVVKTAAGEDSGRWFTSVMDRPDLNGRPRLTLARRVAR